MPMAIGQSTPADTEIQRPIRKVIKVALIPLNAPGGALKCQKAGCCSPIKEASYTSDGLHSRLIYTCENGHTSTLLLDIREASLQEEGDTQPKTPPTMRTKAVGVTFANADGVQRQDILKHVVPGDPLLIEKAAGPKGGQMLMLKHTLGFIGSIRNTTLREFCDAHPGCRISICVVQLTGGTEDKTTIGCNIELACVEGDAGQPIDELLSLNPSAPSQAPAIPDKMVFLDPTKTVFHSDSRCSGMKGGTPSKLHNALYKFHARPCKKCGAAALLEGVR